MRLIPVLDLLDGVVVHAVKGERERYRPVASALVDSAEPLAVSRAFREKLGLAELYVADLNAIQGRGHHLELIARLAKREQLKLLVDAGTADVDSALGVLAAGADKIIIGGETLGSWKALLDIRAAIPPERLIFSLDMQAGRVLSRCPELAALSPLQVVQRLQEVGWRELILLDLARVGTGAGVDRETIAEVLRRYPQAALLAGGGVRDVNELYRLKAAGVAGVLLATALHQGLINRQDVAALSHSTTSSL